ncbi:hypothetical protein IAU60_002176 [Kwoniella sp. DSM 27419]
MPEPAAAGAGSEYRPPRFRSSPPPSASLTSPRHLAEGPDPASSSSTRGAFYPGFLATRDMDDPTYGYGQSPDSPGSSRSSRAPSPTTLPYLCDSPDPASAFASSSASACGSGSMPIAISAPPPTASPSRPYQISHGAAATSRTSPPKLTFPRRSSGPSRAGKRRPAPLDLGKAKETIGLDDEMEMQRDGLGTRRPLTAVSAPLSHDSHSLSGEMQDLSLLRQSVKQNLMVRPLESPLAGSESDRESGDMSAPPISAKREATTEDEMVRITVADTLHRLQSSSQLLIIDTRPLGSFLDSHLPRSANISIPSLIFKRFRKSPKGQTTNWDALGGFVSTEAGRAVWDGLDTDQPVDVILLGESADDELVGVLYGVMGRLITQGHVSVLRGGWGAVLASEEARDILVEGELSTSGRPSLAASLPPPKTASTSAFPPKLPEPLPTVSQPVGHRPSMPSLRAGGPNARRNPPTLSINGGPGTSRRPPKLSLNLDQPIKSATLGSFPHDQPPPTPNSLRRNLLSVDTGNTDPVSPKTSTFSLDIPKTPRTGSFQTIAHKQSKLPPSPSTFGDVVPDPSSTMWPEVSATGQKGPNSAYPNVGMAGRNGIAPFIVSTILPSFLYLGPEITSHDEVDYLSRLGVKRILNVALECNDDADLGLGKRFKYHRIPMRDIVEESGVGQGMRESCDFLDDARLHSAPTYVHCKAGKSRSVTVVLAYLIHANAWTLKTSYAYVAERRKGISPNIGFVAELMQFEESELGLKQSGGVHGEGGGGGRSGESRSGPNDADEGRGGKNPRYMRESMPPVWSSSLDSFSKPQRITVGTDEGSLVGEEGNDGRRPVGDEREVRKDGHWVHHRRAPFDRTTLQPGRRVSKAGLESLRPLNMADSAPTAIRPSPVPSPSIREGVDRNHAATPAAEGQLRWV